MKIRPCRRVIIMVFLLTHLSAFLRSALASFPPLLFFFFAAFLAAFFWACAFPTPRTMVVFLRVFGGADAGRVAGTARRRPFWLEVRASKSHTVAAPARVSQNTQSSLIEISRNLAHRSPEIWRTAVFAEGARNFCNGGGMSENLPQERTSTHNLLQARATRCKTNEQPDEKLLQHPQFIRNVTRTGLGQRPEGAGKKRGGWA